jgi:hypothetical protein
MIFTRGTHAGRRMLISSDETPVSRTFRPKTTRKNTRTDRRVANAHWRVSSRRARCDINRILLLENVGPHIVRVRTKRQVGDHNAATRALSGAKRTSRGHSKSVAPDPKRHFAAVICRTAKGSFRETRSMEYRRGDCWPYSGFILAARITLLRFSVSLAINLLKLAGDKGIGLPPSSASFPLIVGSAKSALVSLLSC